MTAGELNDWMILGGTVAGVVLAWIGWGRKAVTWARTWARTLVARKKATEAMVMSWPTHAQAVVDTAKAVDRIADEVRTLSGSVDALQTRIIGAWDTDPVPQFICNANGRNIDVNRAYCLLTGLSRQELMGFGFKNILHPDDAAAYLEEWESAYTEHRIFRRDARFVLASGAVARVHVEVIPYPQEKAPEIWHGTIKVLGASQ